MSAKASRRKNHSLARNALVAVSILVALWLSKIVVQALRRREVNDASLPAACKASLFEYHEAISGWLSGKQDRNKFEETWERISMAEDAVVVHPTGEETKGSDLKAILKSMHGTAGEGFYTVPNRVHLSHVFPNAVLWRFVEEQHMPDGRIQMHVTTALCEGRQGNTWWTMLHETRTEKDRLH